MRGVSGQKITRRTLDLKGKGILQIVPKGWCLKVKDSDTKGQENKAMRSEYPS